MKSRMKRTFLALAVFGASLALPAAELVERIVARVNDRLITQSEYDRRLSVALKAARSSADPAKLRAQILEDMIREKLLDERAKEMAVAATDEEVEAAVAARQGAVQPEDRRRVRRRARRFGDESRRPAAADARDDHAPEGHRARRRVADGPVGRRPPRRVRAAQGAVLRDPGLGARRRDRPSVTRPATSEAQAEAAIEDRGDPREDQGRRPPFADLAKESSEGNTRDKGGDLGTVAKGELVEALDVAVFSTTDEYPPPALMPDSIHLFHVTERKAAGFKPFRRGQGRPAQADLRRALREAVHRVHGQAAARGLRQDLRPGAREARREGQARREEGLLAWPCGFRSPRTSPSTRSCARTAGTTFRRSRTTGGRARSRRSVEAGEIVFRARRGALEASGSGVRPGGGRPHRAAHLLARPRPLGLRRRRSSRARRSPAGSRAGEGGCSARPGSSRTPSRCS